MMAIASFKKKQEEREEMTKNEIIALLRDDLANEYHHLHFYLESSALVRGLHREELREFFLGQAKSELDHVLSKAQSVGS